MQQQSPRFIACSSSAAPSASCFLVDTRNLGKQAHQEFMAYTPADDGRKFTELYNVQRLASPNIDPHSQVCIGKEAAPTICNIFAQNPPLAPKH